MPTSSQIAQGLRAQPDYDQRPFLVGGLADRDPSTTSWSPSPRLRRREETEAPSLLPIRSCGWGGGPRSGGEAPSGTLFRGDPTTHRTPISATHKPPALLSRRPNPRISHPFKNNRAPRRAGVESPRILLPIPSQGEGVWRQGQSRAAGVIVAGRRLSFVIGRDGGGTGSGWRAGCSPFPACKGTVLRQETEEPRGLAAPARPGLVSTGSNWRKGRGLENGKPRLPSDARPDALGRRDHAEHRR